MGKNPLCPFKKGDTLISIDGKDKKPRGRFPAIKGKEEVIVKYTEYDDADERWELWFERKEGIFVANEFKKVR